jgi:steroid 5-alpha reductase family enzyme
VTEATRRNLLNGMLLTGVMLPSLWATRYLIAQCPEVAGNYEAGTSTAACMCQFGLTQPIAMVNLLFFVNVCVGFWLIHLVQKSTWLVDPYWTILPVLIGHFYTAHPGADPEPTRQWLALGLLWLWSLRLTHNYFRREEWQLGVREDWRFAEKRRSSKHFWWYAFFYAFLSQQFMLVGLTLPLWAVSFRPQPFGVLDGLFAAGALSGVAIAAVADNQLRAFMRANEERVARGEPKVRLLDTGIWRWSRHPNYFGEQLFWWSLAGFGVALGEPWVVMGTVLNSIVLAVVTVMVERKMLAVPERRDEYAAYVTRTSVLVPWPPRAR